MPGRSPALRRLALAGVTISLLAGLPLTFLSQVGRFREIGLGHDRDTRSAWKNVDSVLADLPADEPITVLQSISAHMARRQKLVLMTSLQDADWLVLRLDNQGYPIDSLAYHPWLSERLGTNSAYGVYALAGERVVVLRRGHPRDLNIAARHTARYLEAECLPHRIGRGTLDLFAQNGLACETGPSERQDWALFGFYMDLPPGRYRAGFRIKASGLDAENLVALDVPEQRGNVVLGKIILDRPTSGYEWLETDINVLAGKDVEFRCRKEGGGKIRLDAIRWRRLE